MIGFQIVCTSPTSPAAARQLPTSNAAAPQQLPSWLPGLGTAAAAMEGVKDLIGTRHYKDSALPGNLKEDDPQCWLESEFFELSDEALDLDEAEKRPVKGEAKHTALLTVKLRFLRGLPKD